MKLKKLYSEIIYPKAPYNFDYSTDNPSHYPAPTGDGESGKFWFTMKWLGQQLGIKFENKGNVNKPAIEITVYGKKALDYVKLIKELAYRFEWDVDYSEFYNAVKNDDLLSPVIKKFRGMRGFCGEDLYDYLMITIFLQNTTAKRTAQMTKVMLEKYGTLLEFDNKKLYRFWTPKGLAKIPEQDLRNLKVGYRAKTFLRVSQDFVEDKINKLELRKLPLDDLRKKLLEIYGIGSASVMYILNDVFHHKVLDVIMPWEAKIYSRILFGRDGVSADECNEDLKKRYGKWRAFAIHYLFMDLAWKHRKERIKWAEKLLPF